MRGWLDVVGHTSCCGSGAQGLGKKWSEGPCEMFTTEPRLSCSLGPAVNIPWFPCAPGCCWGHLQLGRAVGAHKRWPSDLVTRWQASCPAAGSRGRLAWPGRASTSAMDRPFGWSAEYGCLCWLLPFCDGLQRMAQVWFSPVKHRKVLETQGE